MGENDSVKTPLEEQQPTFTNTEGKQDNFVENVMTKEKAVPDGGWGWVVVGAAFLINWNIGAMLIAFSLLYPEFTDYFQSQKGITGWIGSFYLAVGTYFGVVFSVLLKQFGCRPVAMVGCGLWSLGYALSSVAPNIGYLYFSYGLIAGMGYSMALLASVVAVQEYFSKRRAMAAGIAASGISLGALCSGPLIRVILDTFQWQGTMLVMAGMVLQGVALSMLFFPLNPQRRIKTSSLIFKRKDTKEIPDDHMRKPKSNTWKEIVLDFFDFSLFFNYRFVLVCFGTFFMNAGMMTFYQHTPSRAEFYGIPKNQIALLPMLTGIATFIARITFGFVANIPNVNRILQYGVSIFIGGLLEVFYFLSTTFHSFIVFDVLIGTINGCFLTVQPTMLVDLMGVKRIARSQAFVNIFQGTGSLVGVPLAGYIFDRTQNYNFPFYVLGMAQMFGGILVVSVVLIEKFRGMQGNKNIVIDDDVELERTENI